MVESLSGLHQHISLSLGKLLDPGEIIAIVDDDAAIREPLKSYFDEHGLAVEECVCAADLLRLLEHRNVALVLLDIGLPDETGLTILPKIVDAYPDVAVVMLTGVADLQVAVDCMRKGAADYLSKPVKFEDIFHVAKKALEKRRLIFENRKYQEELEEAHFRIQLLHQLSMKMNTVYLSTVELDQILRAILVGITANEGLGFNRAFLAMFDDDGQVLRGKMAIGPGCREEAGRVWQEMESNSLNFLEIVDKMRQGCDTMDTVVNSIVRALEIPVSDKENILIKSSLDRRSIKVSSENGSVPVPMERRRLNAHGNRYGVDDRSYFDRRESDADAQAKPSVPFDLINLFDEDTFVVVPLYSPGRSFGVIIADNYITRRPILDSHVSALELFASQASLAIEQSHLYFEMEEKIDELEAVNEELDRSKDLLVEAERYSALGHMAAQLVHIIRNPITSIGGVSRILSKKVEDEEWKKYLNVIISETGRLESTLEDLFDFVGQGAIQQESIPVCATIRKIAMLLQSTMVKSGVTWELEWEGDDPVIQGDLHQIRQVFIHLLKNAVEAMPEGGKVTIVPELQGDRVVISVIDTGLGIPENYLGKAKDPFFTTKTYGTGLGLTLVEQIIAAHGGTFTLTPNVGGGMVARVVFPLY